MSAPTTIRRRCKARRRRWRPRTSPAARSTSSGLASDPEFSPAGGVIGALGALFSGARADPRDQIVDAFLSRLTVFPVPKSRVLQIEFVSRDPGVAARAANGSRKSF